MSEVEGNTESVAQGGKVWVPPFVSAVPVVPVVPAAATKALGGHTATSLGGHTATSLGGHTATSLGGHTATRRVFNFALRHQALIVITSFTLLLIMVAMSAFSLQGTLGTLDREEADIDKAVEREYGYQEVWFSYNGTEAEVTTADNEVLTVDTLTYNGATILFSSSEQLDEKIAKVKNGTYPGELYR